MRDPSAMSSVWSRRPSTGLIAAAVMAFALLGSLLATRSVAIPATRWMNIYEPSDFPTLSSLAAFLAGLRVPIPPVVAAAEAFSVQLTGSTGLVTVIGYRLAMVGSYSIALYLAARTRWRLAVSFGACLLFLWGTVRVHPFNPQVYDVFLPAFVLLWIACLAWAAAASRREAAVALAVLSGIFLAMAELTRPFFLVLLPFALAGSAVYLARRRRALALSLILPVLLISGGWHIHMLLDHGQLFWSNHGGFNLAHAWRQVGVVPPVLVPEPEAMPIAPGRWENLNTAAHAENSDRLSAAVVRFAVQHPAAALTHGLTRMSVYLLGPVPSEPMGIPNGPLQLYRLAVAVGLVYLVVEMVAGGVVLLSVGPPAVSLWAVPAGLLVLTAFGSMVLQALGSAVEEARMVLALLPMVAALPGLGVADYLSTRGSDPQRIGSWLVALALLVLVASFVWDPLRGVPFELSDRQIAGAAVAAGLLVKGLLLRRPGRPAL